MKKIRKLFIIAVLLMGTLLLTTSVQATSDITIEKVEVTNPTSGTYKTGQEITVVVTFSKNISSKVEDAPYLMIKFGGGYARYINAVSVGTKTITYKYTVQDLDGGKLNIPSQSLIIKDESGNDATISIPSTISGSTITVNPVTWTDISKVKFSIDDNYYLNTTGLTELKEHNYHMYIQNSKETPKIETNESGQISDNTYFEKKLEVHKYLEKAGDIYVSICEEQYNYDTQKYENKLIITSQKVERPAQKSLGSRMKAYFFSDETSTFLYEPYDHDHARNIKIKIGKVTDVSVLKSIKNGETNALSKLLTYAKSASSIYTGTVSLGDSDTITKNLNITDKEYYYVYLELDDEKGKYYPVEDVSLYQALIGESIGKNLFDYLSDEFKWNISEEDNFSDFSKAKTLLNDFVVNTNKPEENKITFVIKNVASNAQIKHKFFFYLSNSKTDVPQYDSELWTEAANYSINKDTGICTIDTGNLYNLSYIDKLNLSADLYISVYEIISDEEIKTDKISGNYKLVANAKLVNLIEEEDNKNQNNNKPETPKDTTQAPISKIPQTGQAVAICFIIAGTLGCAVFFYIKSKKYNY